jgi:hypothetical protein
MSIPSPALVMSPSLVPVLALLSIVSAFAIGIYLVRRRAARRRRMRALGTEHRYWALMQRSLEQGWGDHWHVEQHIQYVGEMIRRRGMGAGVEHSNIYHLSRSAKVRRDAHHVRSGFFHLLMHFIPRQIRSPWFEHLLEDRERMALEGRSRRFIAAATAVQCLSLLVHVLWERLWDLLTPFKPRLK